MSAAGPVRVPAFRERVEPGDVAAVRELVAATGVFAPAEVAIAAELAEEARRAGPACGYHFLLAGGPDRLAGYTCFGPVPATVGSFDLYWIAVAAAWRGRGLARSLLERTEARAAALGARKLWVDTSGREVYARARAFYEGAGFGRVAVLADFYAPGDAKVIYAKALDRGAASASGG